MNGNFVPASVRVCKRTLDVFGSALGLLLLSPLFLLVAAAIKLDSPGPILFRQRRLGISTGDGPTEFFLYKFRSMIVNAEALTGPVLAEPDDPRITRVGLFMRKTRIDELPQLWNVLRGDMSIVGPRPERPELAPSLEAQYPLFNERTYAVKPGITGFAQVEMSYDEAARQVYGKMAYDYGYAMALSDFWAWVRMDIWILFKTIYVAVRGRGG